MAQIFPSLISADSLNLQKEIELLDPHTDGYHLDIMDNHFVPNLTWGPMVVNAIAKATRRKLWAHLMVDNPMDWDNILFLPPASILTFHFETEKEIPRLIKKIKEKKWLVSLAINPKTPVEEIFPIINALDQILLMSVEPGFSGQPFLESTIEKLDRLDAYRQTSDLQFRIGMDGGINAQNIAMLHKKGVDDFAIAGGIFNQADHVTALQELKKLVQ